MRGILCLLPLCLFCLGWSNGTASHLAYHHAPHSSKDAISHPSQSPPGTAVPSPDESGPVSPPLLGSAEGGVFADWQIFNDAGLGLTIFGPPGWQFVEDVQEWTLTDGVAEQARAALTGLLMQLQSSGQSDSLIGIGYVSPQFYTDLLHVNQFAVEIFPSNGLTLYQFGRGAAAQLERQTGTDVDSLELVTRLRPNREEAISVRFRGGVPARSVSQSVLTGARTVGWQVALMSPDGEFVLVLTFSAPGEQFDLLEPLFEEMVRRVQWAYGEAPEPAAGPVAFADWALQVHAGPAPFSPVIGEVVAGSPFSVIERDVTGTWWRISHGGQPGWVSDHLMAANLPDAPAAVPVAMIEGRVNVRSGPGASNPIIDVVIPGQQYLITGRSEEGDWLQIDDHGRLGWVYAELVTAVDAGNVQVAVIDFPNPPLLQIAEAMITVNWGMNVRGGPDISYPIIGSASPGQQYTITGKNSAGDWWQIDHDGRPGWVFGDLVTPVNPGSVPVVTGFPLPPLLPDTEAELTFSRSMNVYDGPDARYPVVDTTLPGYRYPVSGRNAVGSWWRIDIGGRPGWVFGQLARTVVEMEGGR